MFDSFIIYVISQSLFFFMKLVIGSVQSMEY